jgi:hypothetical protein
MSWLEATTHKQFLGLPPPVSGLQEYKNKGINLCPCNNIIRKGLGKYEFVGNDSRVNWEQTQ